MKLSHAKVHLETLENALKRFLMKFLEEEIQAPYLVLTCRDWITKPVEIM